VPKAVLTRSKILKVAIGIKEYNYDQMSIPKRDKEDTKFTCGHTENSV
jgi:hypothetical protein